MFSEWIAQAIKIHHPHVMGHQVGVSAPVAALADLLGSLLDTGNGVYEVGNPATAIERAVICDLCERMNLGPRSGGFITSGGTLGNLTALLAARRVAAPQDVWQEGNSSDVQLGVLVSEEAHYCMDRAARIMGWGEAGVIKVCTDSNRRLTASALETSLKSATARGIKTIAAVGNSCTTGTGVFDPLEEIAEFCENHQLWFHVDAAHGGAAIFSENHRSLLNGIEHANSVVIDFHKLMLTPSLATAVLFRDESTSFAFSQQADYLWREASSNEELPWYDAARRTMECTRSMSALRIYAILATHGQALIEANVDRVFEAAQEFADLLDSASDFELFAHPQANIVCFRYRPLDLSKNELSDLNSSIRSRLIRKGNHYIVETKFEGNTWLRCAIMNPFTNIGHMRALLQAIRKVAKDATT